LLAFFRINDPYRFIGIFLLIIAVRLPFFLGEMPLILPELEWMVVGESISFSNMLYSDVWDDIPPLSALVYSLLDFIFGRSQWAYQILALLIVFGQCVLFNQLLIANKAYKENTYVPAMIFTILMALFFDFFTLSPVLMSGFFILLVINGIFFHIAHKARDERFLNMGLSLGFAVLFFLPSLIYLPIVLLTLGLYSNMDLKKYVLLFFGFIFPLVLVGIFFFWHGALREFLDYYFLSWISTPINKFVEWRTLFFIGLPTAILLIFAWISVYSAKRYNNQQTNFLLVMMWFLIGAFAIIFVVKDRAPHQMMVFIPPCAFYLSHFFLLIRRKFLAEIFFLSFFATTLLINFGTLRGLIVPPKWLNFEGLLTKSTPWDDLVAGKRVLIIGNDLNAYAGAQLATPYLNWELSKRHFNQLQHFNNLSLVYENFTSDLPHIIIDQKNIVPELFQQMPTIASRYTKGNREDAYVLVD